MYQIPASIFLLFLATTVFLWANLILALIVRIAVRHDRRAVEAIFGIDTPNGLSVFKSYRMRVKLFFPWVVACDMSEHSESLKVLLWSARLAGSGLIITFLLLVGDFIYLASSGA